ncbi:MAG: hypothetical protein GC160_30245 [Acidobacteria bacterium]|nr:hypothetical protein [Acidobacteriota bacterium]
MSEESGHRDLGAIAAKIDALAPGPELDARSAQLIGWEILGVAKRFSHGVEPGGGDRKVVPRFSSDIAATFELEEQILAGEHAALYIAHLTSSVQPDGAGRHGAEHLGAIAHAGPEVRCRAALKACLKIPVAGTMHAPPSPVRKAVRFTPSNDSVELL